MWTFHYITNLTIEVMLILGFFALERKPSIIYEGIVLQLCIILREDIVRE